MMNIPAHQRGEISIYIFTQFPASSPIADASCSSDRGGRGGSPLSSVWPPSGYVEEKSPGSTYEVEEFSE